MRRWGGMPANSFPKKINTQKSWCLVLDLHAFGTLECGLFNLNMDGITKIDLLCLRFISFGTMFVVPSIAEKIKSRSSYDRYGSSALCRSIAEQDLGGQA